jgi:hypothetical protein
MANKGAEEVYLLHVDTLHIWCQGGQVDVARRVGFGCVVPGDWCVIWSHSVLT